MLRKVFNVNATKITQPNMQCYLCKICLLYTSDAADDLLCVDLGGRRIIKKKNNTKTTQERAAITQ